MSGMILDWLSHPEAQPELHYWLAVAAGHVLIGIVGWAVFAAWGREVIEGHRAFAFGVVAGFYALWEAAQIAFFGGGVVDSLTDAAFVAGGALIAWGAWANSGKTVAATVTGLLALARIGRPRK